MNTAKRFTSSFCMSLLVLSAFALCASNANAHSAWLEVRDGKAVLIDGHPDDPSDNRKYEAFRLVHGAAYDNKMKGVPVNISHDGESKIDITSGTALVVAHFNNGFWSVSASEGWVRKPASQVPDATRSMYSHKYTKLYLSSVSNPDKPLGHPLEIVPLVDPTKLKPGDVLKVRVTLFGEPLVDKEVAVDLHAGDDAVKVNTDSEGVASLKVPARPLALLQVSHSVGLSNDPHVSSLALSSTISFQPSK